MSSPKSPEFRSQLDDIGNSTADVLAEPPNGWPVSAPSSTGNLGSLENGSSNNLQGLDTLSENQTFGGALSENATWGFQTELAAVSSLPSVQPPTDMSSVPQSNGSLWPLFSIDTDWQLDFDDRLITEPSSTGIGATPVALNELDPSQSYSQSTHDSESPTLPRGLADYLSPGGKVSGNAIILTQIYYYLYIILRVRLAQREAF